MFLKFKESAKFVRRWAAIGIAALLRAGSKIAPWASIAAAIIAIIAFRFGYRQFRATQEATRETLTMQRESLDLDRESKAIELFPHHAEYYGLMAFIFLDEKEFELALQKADEGLALDPENITCLNARARAQNKLRQTNEAIATMQDALAIDPDNEFTHVTIGWNFLEKGKHKEATTHFREALRISPAHHSAKVGLKEALKSKIPPYRWLLQFNFWMQNKSKAFRWVFIISILVGVRLIEGFSKENPQFENAGIVVAACYFLFVGTSWIINPLANVFLLFHKDGKYALENSEKWNAIAFIICILSGIILIILSSVVPDKEQTGNFIASGFIVLSLCVPAGHMNYPVRIKGNSFSQWIAISLLLSAVIAVLCTLTGLIAPMVFFVIYFILFVVYTWSKAF